MTQSTTPPPGMPSTALSRGVGQPTGADEASGEGMLDIVVALRRVEETVRELPNRWTFGVDGGVVDGGVLKKEGFTVTVRFGGGGSADFDVPAPITVWRPDTFQGAGPAPSVGAELSKVQHALYERLVRVSMTLVRSLPEADTVKALSAATDLGSLAYCLQRAPHALQPVDPVTAAAYARGRVAREALLKAAGGVVSAEELAVQLKVTRQAVDKRRRAGKLLALRERGDWIYPAWQVTNGHTLEGFEDVLQELIERGASPWDMMLFFLETDTEREDETPLAALEKGRLEVAMSAARAYGEQGAR